MGFDISTGWYTSDGIDTLFVEDSHRKGYWHPRIGAQHTEHYRNLPDWQKDAFNRLHDDFSTGGTIRSGVILHFANCLIYWLVRVCSHVERTWV